MIDPDLGLYLHNHSNRLAFDLDYVQQYQPQRCAILEIGAWPFFLTNALQKLGYAVTGLDKIIETTVPLIAAAGVPVVKCDLEKEAMPLPDESFDVVLFNEIFEHLRADLIRVVRDILRVLKPGGMLMLSTPNLRSLLGLRNLLIDGEACANRGDLFDEYSGATEGGAMGHVREYTPVEVTKFLRRCGFTIDGLIFRSDYGSGFPVWWHYLAKIKPDLKPFFSIVATKPS
jgi:SAM-dependent methyltransferase